MPNKPTEKDIQKENPTGKPPQKEPAQSPPQKRGGNDEDNSDSVVKRK